MGRSISNSIDAETAVEQVAEFIAFIDESDLDGQFGDQNLVAVGIDIVEGADAIRSRGTSEQEQQVALFATSEDGTCQVDYRVWLPVKPGTEDDEQDAEVFDAAYREYVEALDAALTARERWVTDAAGGYRCEAPVQQWHR